MVPPLLFETKISPAGARTADGDARERQLLAQIAQGDRAALEELYLQYHRRLARFLTRLTHRYDIAEEVINDTFWVVWTKANQFRGGSQVSTWIMGIAYRRALRSLRSIRRPEISLDAVEPIAVEPQPAEELRDLVGHALERLSVEHRLAIELAYFMGHSCEEIAEIMDCPVNTVKTRLHYAREKLRTLLPQLAGAAPGAAP